MSATMKYAFRESRAGAGAPKRLQAGAALLAGAKISRVRITQIMDLLMLAPDIQERLLTEPNGCIDVVSFQELLRIALTHHWEEQRREWRGSHTGESDASAVRPGGIHTNTERRYRATALKMGADPV